MEGNMDMLKIILSSGIIVKLVLLFLILCSILSWAIVLFKKKQLQNVRKMNKQFMNHYNSDSSLNDILTACDNYPLSTLACLYKSGYGELLKFGGKVSGDSPGESLRKHFSTFGMGAIERALKKGVNKNQERMDAQLSILASIGSISPFIGLFGTVWGIIDSFTGLSKGGGSIEAVAPGIAEALVATAVGLFAAIPAVLFFNHFSSENSKLLWDMETFGQDFLNLIERRLIVRVK